MKKGDKILVLTPGSWYEAEILAVDRTFLARNPDGLCYRVRCDGGDPFWTRRSCLKTLPQAVSETLCG